MKVSEKKIEKKSEDKFNASLLKAIEALGEHNYDELTLAIAELNKTIGRKEIRIPEFPEIRFPEGSDYTEVIREITERLDGLSEVINGKPSSFEFIMQRNERGLIQKVIVVPLK